VTAADFGSWWIFELKISLGELANALAVIGIGFYVAHVIERRQANRRAANDVVAELCRDSRGHLSSLSELLETECKTGGQLSAEARNSITHCLQRFSNSIHSVEVATQKASLAKAVSIQSLKSHRESLRTQIMEPLAVGPTIDTLLLRQIEGVILQAREALVEFEIGVHQS
jgi:hypothetical protein